MTPRACELSWVCKILGITLTLLLCDEKSQFFGFFISQISSTNEHKIEIYDNLMSCERLRKFPFIFTFAAEF